MKTRALIWLTAVAALALLTGWMFTSGGWQFQSNLLSLLPESRQDELQHAAYKRLAGLGQQRLIIAFGANHSADAKRAAKAASAVLRQSPAFTGVASAVGDWPASPRGQDRLFAHRFHLLSPRDRDRLLDYDAAAAEHFLQRAQARAFGLNTGSGSRFVDDPFGLLAAWRRSDGIGGAAPGLAVDGDGHLQATDGQGRAFAVLFAETTASPFSFDRQGAQMTSLDQALAAARRSSPDVRIIVSGVLRHAAAATRQAKREVSRIGLVSLAGITVLMLLAFRSLRPAALSLMVLAGGCLFALAGTAALFGNLHVLTVVFGASIVGVAIDYCFHFFAQRWHTPEPGAALRRIFPAISLGLLSSLLAYISMAAAPFPGLRQMAVFAALGLLGAWAGVLLWLPAVAGPAPRRTKPLELAGWWLARGPARLSSQWPVDRMGNRRGVAAALFLVALCGFGVYLLAEPDDDIRLLHSSPQQLLDDEARIRGLLDLGTGTQAILIRGDSPAQVLRREAALLEKLQQADPGVRVTAITQRFQPEARQRENHALLRQTLYVPGGPAQQLLQTLGFDDSAVKQHLRSFTGAEGNTLPLDDWLDSADASGRRALWLGQVDGQWASLVPLHGVGDPAVLEKLVAVHPQVKLIDQVARVSGLLGHYRRLAGWLLAGAYVLAGLVLWRCLGAVAAAAVLLPPVLASLATVLLFTLAGWTFSLFNLMAMILLLGMGVDYGIFLRMAGDDVRPAMLAVGLSAATTLLAFGVLAFSATGALQGFGLTLAIGLALTFLLASTLHPPVRRHSVST